MAQRKQASGGTPATRELTAAGIPFTEHTYTHDSRAASFGLEAADELDVDPARVFKTLVLALDDTGLGVAILPVNDRVDPKAAARLLGAKKATLADPAVAERSSGYVVGGISPFGQKRRLPTALDASAEAHASILVSGGRRGFDVEVTPADLVRVLSAHTGDLTRTTSQVGR